MGSALSSSDLRAVVALAGESCELPRGSRERKMHAMQGLAKLVDAQVIVFGQLLNGPPPRLVSHFDLGWSGERERRVFADYTQLPDAPPDPTLARMLCGGTGEVVTLSRDDLIGHRDWYRSAHVQELRRHARVDAFLYSGYFSSQSTHAFSFHRAWGERGFDARERALVDAFHAGSPWLHDEPRAAMSRGLPLRLAQVLELLASGHSEKQVAAALSLSQHTVHDYVKALHRRFRVSSRGELLALALKDQSWQRSQA